MAFSFKQRECETCGGALRYLEDQQVYECTYCGKVYERAESYDGQYSVRNAAEQSLFELVEGNLARAEENLNTCQMIDPSYPGTIVAHLAYELQVARRAADRSQRQLAIAQATGHYRQLQSPFDPRLADDEADFYDRLQSSDVRSLLQTTFALLKDTARAAYVQQGFDASAMHSAMGAAALVERSFAAQSWTDLDAVIDSPVALDADGLLVRLLDTYPSGERKVHNLAKVLERGVDGQRAREALSTYVTSTSDEASCRMQVAEAFSAAGISMRGSAFAQVMAAEHDSELLDAYARATAAVPQGDEDMSAIVDGALASLGVEQMGGLLGEFSRAGAYLVFSQRGLMDMLQRRDLPASDKAACLDLARQLGMDERRAQGLLGALLRSPYDPSDKPAVVDALASQLSWVNPRRVEEYLLRCEIDGAAKPAIVERLLAGVQARASLRQAARRYEGSGTDAPEVHARVMSLLEREGLTGGRA